MLAPHRICGTFVALSLQLRRIEALFNQLAPASPWLFDGLVIRASTIRNKLGRTGGSTIICAATEPATPVFMRREDHMLLAPAQPHASHT
jgi:hypothetical protein